MKGGYSRQPGTVGRDPAVESRPGKSPGPSPLFGRKPILSRRASTTLKLRIFSGVVPVRRVPNQRFGARPGGLTALRQSYHDSCGGCRPGGPRTGPSMVRRGGSSLAAGPGGPALFERPRDATSDSSAAASVTPVPGPTVHNTVERAVLCGPLILVKKI